MCWVQFIQKYIIESKVWNCSIPFMEIDYYNWSWPRKRRKLSLISGGKWNSRKVWYSYITGKSSFRSSFLLAMNIDTRYFINVANKANKVVTLAICLFPRLLLFAECETSRDTSIDTFWFACFRSTVISSQVFTRIIYAIGSFWFLSKYLSSFRCTRKLSYMCNRCMQIMKRHISKSSKREI